MEVTRWQVRSGRDRHAYHIRAIRDRRNPYIERRIAALKPKVVDLEHGFDAELPWRDGLALERVHPELDRNWVRAIGGTDLVAQDPVLSNVRPTVFTNLRKERRSEISYGSAVTASARQVNCQ